MRYVLVGLVGVAALVVGVGLWVRIAPSDPARWHVDPLVVADPGSPNYARLPAAEVTGADVATLAVAARDAMLAMPRTTLLAGSAQEGWMTFITRSALMSYPDYTSIRILPDPAGAMLVAFARSRFGQSDLGVNAKRLEALRTVLAQQRVGG